MDMTTQPPKPEAVEAAMKYCKAENDNDRWFILPFRIPHTNETPDEACSRILAAEVERLRAKEDAVCEWNGFSVHGRIHYRTCRGVLNYTEMPRLQFIPYCPGCGRKVKITTNDK